MPTPGDPFRPHPSVVFTQLDDSEAALLHLETKRYYSLNETGIRIWERLGDGMSPADVSTALQEEYEVEPEEALAYALEFLEELHQEGLILKGAS